MNISRALLLIPRLSWPLESLGMRLRLYTCEKGEGHIEIADSDHTKHSPMICSVFSELHEDELAKATAIVVCYGPGISKGLWCGVVWCGVACGV